MQRRHAWEQQLLLAQLQQQPPPIQQQRNQLLLAQQQREQQQLLTQQLIEQQQLLPPPLVAAPAASTCATNMVHAESWARCMSAFDAEANDTEGRVPLVCVPCMPGQVRSAMANMAMEPDYSSFAL